MQLNKSIFPMELEFTIDGINGLKYGDVLSFDGLPKRYTESFVFTILGITHAVSNEGEWTTQVKCNPRIRIKGK
jgi:phage protein D